MALMERKLYEKVSNTGGRPINYVPCRHADEKREDYTCCGSCPCVRNHTFCEKFCQCSERCENRFVGCRCKSVFCIFSTRKIMSELRVISEVNATASRASVLWPAESVTPICASDVERMTTAISCPLARTSVCRDICESTSSSVSFLSCLLRIRSILA